MPDLAVLAVFFDGGEARFDWRLRVDPVQIVESYAAGAKSPKTFFDFSSKVLGATATWASRPALGGHEGSPEIWGERCADRSLAFAARIRVSSVDHPQPRIECRLDESDIRRRIGETVRPEPQAGDLDVTEFQRRG